MKARRPQVRLIQPDRLVIFIALDDEHLAQIATNIGQIKDRGAKVVVISVVKDLLKVVDDSKVDLLIELTPVKSLFAAIQACVALQLICYYTSVARGLNPDQQIFDAIDFDHAF